MTTLLNSLSHLPSPPSPPLPSIPNDGSPSLLSPGHSHSPSPSPNELSILTLLVEVVRRPLAGRRAPGEEEGRRSMEIGSPTDVQHVAHVTFDRFHGFLGLPVEFEPEVPRRAPSASANVFGVSTESMQCSYDSRGNSVPTTLLLMQRRLYEQGGLQAEGIFRINGNNGQEEYVRDQLNTGNIPDGTDVHCLAGLIKAWFRELPTGVLDPLTPEQVMQCQSEEDQAQLVKLLPPSEAALLDWAINLMADVVQEEQANKMNVRNVAMVFAPNMTQMADPLTALMYAVEVMNFLKTLILKTLKRRQESAVDGASVPHLDPSNDNDCCSSQLDLHACSQEETEAVPIPEEPVLFGLAQVTEDNSTTDDATIVYQTCEDNLTLDSAVHSMRESLCGIQTCSARSSYEPEDVASVPSTTHVTYRRTRSGRSGSKSHRRGRKTSGQSAAQATLPDEKPRGANIMNHINSKVERVEAWR